MSRPTRESRFHTKYPQISEESHSASNKIPKEKYNRYCSFIKNLITWRERLGVGFEEINSEWLLDRFYKFDAFLDESKKLHNSASVITKGRILCFCDDVQKVDAYYTAICEKKTSSMVALGKENPDIKRGMGLKFWVDRLGPEAGKKHYDELRHKQKSTSKRSILYWLNLGYSEEDARVKVAEHQTNFSLSICIEKYGIYEGTRVWEERQRKWQESLNSK